MFPNHRRQNRGALPDIVGSSCEKEKGIEVLKFTAVEEKLIS